MSGVFISYRRSDSAAWAGRVYERLVADYGPSNVFFDVDSIGLGLDFRDVIASTLESCSVALVLVGPQWLAVGPNGTRRIDSEKDLHRIEVATVLDSGIRVIPVLLEGARMPDVDELPPDLRRLTFRNALSVQHDSFSRDMALLEQALTDRAGKPLVAAPARKPARATQRARLRHRQRTLAIGAAATLVAIAVIGFAVRNRSTHSTALPTSVPATNAHDIASVTTTASASSTASPAAASTSSVDTAGPPTTGPTPTTAAPASVSVVIRQVGAASAIAPAPNAAADAGPTAPAPGSPVTTAAPVPPIPDTTTPPPTTPPPPSTTTTTTIPPVTLNVTNCEPAYCGQYVETGQQVNGFPIYRHEDLSQPPSSQFRYTYIFRFRVAFTASRFVWVIQPLTPDPDKWQANSYVDADNPWEGVWTKGRPTVTKA